MRFIGIFCGSILVLFSLALKAQEGFKSEDELKEKAQELFQNLELVKAEPLYAQLLSLYPKDPEYNYKYGACLLAADADKEKPMKYLQFASSKSGVDPLAYYYLGRAHHLNYNFGKAVKAYSKFKNKASSDDKEKYQVERQIEMCKNGNDLLTRLNEVQVLDKQEISAKDFFRIYDLKGIDGKIITKPEEFKSKYDKKTGESSIIYLPNAAKEVYYSSFGKKGESGRDIYRVVKLGNDSWSDPVKLGPSINTPYDENYAFIHPDGRTLYFASKGHSSMGGYDLFQSTYDDAINDWTAPVNLDFAFSSVDDDVLFITDEDKVLAFFASNRGNAEGKFTVYKVKVDKAPADISVIQGKFIAENNPEMTKAKITVIDQATNQTVGVYETDKAGNYQVEINDNGGTYKFNIETTANSPIHTGIVNVPKQSEFEVLGQELRLVGTGDDQQLVIKNIFDGTATPRNPSGPQISSDFLRKKASLEVNLSASDLLALESSNKSPDALSTSTNKPSSNGGDEQAVSGNTNSGTNQSGNQSNTSGQNESTAQNNTTNTSTGVESTKDTPNSSNSNSSNSLGTPSTTPIAGANTSTGGVADLNSNSDNSNGTNSTGNAEEGRNVSNNQNNGAPATNSPSITDEISNIKDETSQDLESNQKAQAYAYQQANQYAESANKLFEELNNQKASGEKDESYKSNEEEAKRLALQSAYSLKFAKDIESNTNEKEERLNKIEELESESASLEGDAIRQKVRDIQMENQADLGIAQSLSLAKKESQQALLMNAESIASISSKKESFESEQRNLDEQIIGLQEERKTANDERKAEIDKLIAGYELDKQDMAYQVENAQKQYDNALAKESALQVKLEEIEKLEGQWKNTTAASSAMSEEAKANLDDQVKTFVDEGLLAFDSEELNTSGSGLNFDATASSAEGLASKPNSASSTGSPVSGKPISQINSYYETELVLAEKQTDADIQKARKIETYNNWLSDLEDRQNILSSANQPGTNKEAQAELSTISQKIATIRQDKSTLENQLASNSNTQLNTNTAVNAADQSNTNSSETTANQTNDLATNNQSEGLNSNSTNQNRVPIPKPDPSAYSPNETVGSVDVSGVNEQSIIPEGFTNFDMNQDFTYTNPQVLGSLSSAKKSYAAAATYGKKAKDARAAAYSLETTEERNQAFTKALEYEKASKQKEIEAAQLLGETNAKEYTRNSAQLSNVANFADEYDSQNLDLANLLNEEAAVYYNKALEERSNVNPESRLALQETKYQKAYDYEILALTKQKEALELLQIVNAELQTNSSASVFEINNVVETPIAQDLEAGSSAGQTTGSIQVVQPAVVSNSLRTVNLDTVQIDETRKSIVINSSSYQDFLSQVTKREQALKTAEIDYEQAVQKESKRQQLIKEAQVLRLEAEAATDQEEKARLIKSAEVIDQEVAQLSVEIDNLNASILANNLIVEQADQSMNATLASLSEQEKLEYQKLASENLDASPVFANQRGQEQLASNQNNREGESESTSTEQSRAGADLSNLSAENSNLNSETSQDLSNTSSNQTESTDNAVANTSEVSNSSNSSNNSKPAGNTSNIPEGPSTPSNNSNGASSSSSANIDLIPRIVKQAIFVKLDPKKSAYDDSKPIPVNPNMPEGLVYKIQIGAFRNPIPQDLFKGFAPLMAEKVPSGITRYTAGIFINEREAVGVRNEIRQLGYPDAFVVAFLNGKRVSIAQARKTDSSADGLADADSPGSSSSTGNVSTGSSSSNISLVEGGSTEGLSTAVKATSNGTVKNAASIKGLYYTVQIGVYSKPIPAGQFASYQDVNVIVLNNGMTRYNSGIFESAVDANQLKNDISANIKDAFVTAYYNGKRISLGEAARIANQN